MKVGPVTKFDKRNTATSDVLSTNDDVIFTFYFLADLEQSRSQPPDAWSADITKIKEVPVLQSWPKYMRQTLVLV